MVTLASKRYQKRAKTLRISSGCSSKFQQYFPQLFLRFFRVFFGLRAVVPDESITRLSRMKKFFALENSISLLTSEVYKSLGPMFVT